MEVLILKADDKSVKFKEETLFGFIGMRVVKTVLAVYLCFTISLFREASLPFYSAIAAILCMKTDHSDGLDTGKSRMIGTLIGGLYGFLAVILVKFLQLQLFGPIHYLILSLFLIPIIYTNVNIKSHSSTYISCVVFLSITVAHGSDVSPMLFALNRVIDTFIGIGVSVGVNRIL